MVVDPSKPSSAMETESAVLRGVSKKDSLYVKRNGLNAGNGQSRGPTTTFYGSGNGKGMTINAELQKRSKRTDVTYSCTREPENVKIAVKHISSIEKVTN